MSRKDPQSNPGVPRRKGAKLLPTLLLIFVALPALWVAVYKVVPPPITVLMLERLAQGRGLDHRWTPLEEISPSMIQAVVASEDSRFCIHHGFDLKAINAAISHDLRKSSGLRGGSTISQQTAKNVFLWPERSWVRKGLEAGFTVLIELLWGKSRIMEVYLNTIEMGPGIYGVEAASRHYFHKSARAIDSRDAARLAAMLPSPLKRVRATPAISRKVNRIEARAGEVGRDQLAGCVTRHRARAPRLGVPR